MAEDDAAQPDAARPDGVEPEAVQADDVQPGTPVTATPHPEAAPPHASDPEAKRRRRWLLVAVPVAVLVLVATAVLGAQRARLWLNPRPSGVAPGSTAVLPSGVPGEQPGFALGGAGNVVLYLQSSGAIQRADLGSGAATVTSTPELPPVSNLVAGPGWVLSKTVGAPSGVLVPDGGIAQLPPVAVQQAGRAYPGGSGGIWVLPEQASDGGRTAVLIGANGERLGDASIRVPQALGIPIGHLGSSLIAVNDQGTYTAGADGSRRLSPGTLLAVGTDAVLSWGCSAKGSCDARLDSPGRATAYQPAVRTSLLGLYGKDVTSAAGFRGALSPDRRWVALHLPKPTRSGSTLVVVDLRSGHRIEVPGTFAGQNGSDQAAWTPNSRYLLALTDGRLRAFDSLTGRVVTFGGTLVGLRHLTITDTATM